MLNSKIPSYLFDDHKVNLPLEAVLGFDPFQLVSLYQSASGLGKASGIDRQWASALRTENPVPQWDYACDLRTTGFHCQASGFGTQASGQPYSIPRCIRSKQQTPGASDTSQAREKA